MGRPINYKKKGGNPSESGFQFVLRAWFDGQMAEEDAYIVKQVGTSRFILAAVSNRSRTGIFTLGEQVVQGSVATMSAEPFGATAQVGFTATDVTLISNGATGVSDGQYQLGYNTGTDDWIIITFEVVDGEFVSIVGIDEGGVSPTDLTGQTLEFTSVGILMTVDPEVRIDTMEPAFGQKTEFVSKILQHRVVTFEGNSYTYEFGPAADETGEADVPFA